MSARSIETCDEADCHRVIAQSEHDWNGVVSSRGCAALAAYAASPIVKITATRILTSSAANAGSRS
jgi:hypothetical protein